MSHKKCWKTSLWILFFLKISISRNILYSDELLQDGWISRSNEFNITCPVENIFFLNKCRRIGPIDTIYKSFNVSGYQELSFTVSMNFGRGVLPEINNNEFNIMYRCSYNNELAIIDTDELQIVRTIGFQLDSKCSDNDNIMIYFSLWDSSDSYVYLKNFQLTGKPLLDNETLSVINMNTLYYFDYFTDSEWDSHGSNITICDSTLNCNCIDDYCTILPPLTKISTVLSTTKYINITVHFTVYIDVRDSLGAGQPTVLLVYYCGSLVNTRPFGILPRWTVITDTLDASCENNDNVTIEFESISGLNIAYLDDFYVFGDLTQSPTQSPSILPTLEPTNIPSLSPTMSPSNFPTMVPSISPTNPTASPSIEPTTSPSIELHQCSQQHLHQFNQLKHQR